MVGGALAGGCEALAADDGTAGAEGTFLDI